VAEYETAAKKGSRTLLQRGGQTGARVVKKRITPNLKKNSSSPDERTEKVTNPSHKGAQTIQFTRNKDSSEGESRNSTTESGFRVKEELPGQGPASGNRRIQARSLVI